MIMWSRYGVRCYLNKCIRCQRYINQEPLPADVEFRHCAFKARTSFVLEYCEVTEFGGSWVGLVVLETVAVREQQLFGSVFVERAPKHSVGDALEEEENPIVHKVRIHARIQGMNIESN